MKSGFNFKDVYEVADHISRELAIRILREENAKEFRISQIHHQLPAGAQQVCIQISVYLA